MARVNSGTDSDDLPVISRGGWRVGAVYKTNRIYRVRQLDEHDRVSASIKIEGGAYWLCTDIIRRSPPNQPPMHWTNEFALFDVYSSGADGQLRPMMRLQWYAGDSAFGPEQNGFEVDTSPLTALAVAGTI